MRMRPSWVPALAVLGVAAGRAWAQSEGEVFIPEESCACDFVFVPSGPLDGVLEVLLLGCALLPLVAAWSCLHSLKHEAARRWTILALVLACAQGMYGTVLLFDPSSARSVPSWMPGWQEIEALVDHPPEWGLFLGAGALGAAAAWWTERVNGARRWAPARPVAGSRIRMKDRVDAA